MKEKIFSKFKDITIYFFKWFFNSGVITIPCLYLVYKLATYNNDAEKPETLFYINMLVLFFIIGCMVFTFYKSYSKRKLDDNLDAIPSYSKKKNEISFKILKWTGNDTSYPLWEILHWIFVIGFLILSCWVMHDGLSSLFIKTDTPTKVFEWFFSILIGLTLFWLVYMITRGKHLIAYLIFYLVVLFAPLTMNFFHFYNNVSQTQRMDTAVKYSHTFVAKISKKISNEITAKTNSLGTSILDKVSDLEKKIADNNEEIKSLPQRTSVSKGGVRDDGTTYYYTTDEKNPRIVTLEANNRNHEQALKRLQESENWKKVQNLKEELLNLKKADTICIEINKEYEKFNRQNTKKENQLSIKNDIVKKVNDLYGSLEKSSILDEKDKTMREIITMPDVNRVEGIGELFEFFTELFNPNPQSEINKAKEEFPEVRQIEKRLIIMSLSMSLLIDITPLIMGLLVVFAYRKDD